MNSNDGIKFLICSYNYCLKYFCVLIFVFAFSIASFGGVFGKMYCTSLLSLADKHTESSNNQSVILLQIAEPLLQHLNDNQIWLQYYIELGKAERKNQNYDEAIEAFEKSKHYTDDDSVLAAIYSLLAVTYGKKADWEQATSNFIAALNQNIKLKNIAEVANNFNNLGSIYKISGNFTKALFYYEQALKVRSLMGDELKVLESINNIGSIYYLRGQYNKAIEHFNKTLLIILKYQLPEQLSVAYNNIGVVYSAMENYSKSLEYYKKALEIDLKNNLTYSLARDYNNLGVIYSMQKNWDTALIYYDRAFELHQKYGITDGLLDVLGNLSILNLQTKNFQKAAYYIEKTKIIADERGDVEQLVNLYINLGALYLEQKNYANSLIFFDNAKQLAARSGLIKAEIDIYKSLSEVYERNGNTRKAFDFFKKYISLKDSLLSEKTKNEVAQIESKYLIAIKEQQIQLLNEENKVKEIELLRQKENRRNQIYIFTAGIIVVVLISVFIYQRYRIKQKNLMRQTLAEQQKLRFIIVIEALEKERIRFAQDLHDSLGQILSTARLNISGIEEYVENSNKSRKIYDNIIALVDEACHEIRNISHNIMPSTLIRLGLVPALRDLVRKINEAQQLKVELDVDDTISRYNDTIEIAIFRIFQEMLNNILKHSGASKICIFFSQANNLTRIEFTDDGVPIDLKQVEMATGIGWQNIYSRITMLNGTISITSNINKQVAGRNNKIVIEFEG